MRENISVGSHLCFVTSVAKKLRLADIYTSTAPVAKTFSRARRKKIGRRSYVLRSRQSKTSAAGHFYFGRASRKNFQSRQAQKESVSGHM